MAQLNFDSSNVTPSQSFDPIPAGDYVAHIIESEIKKTKAGNGQYLQLVWEIVDGKYKGRRIWDRLNILNKNAVAQEIAERDLAAICQAVGVIRCADSKELHNKPCKIRVRIRQQSGYDPTNEIRGYSAINGSQPEKSGDWVGDAAAKISDNRPPWAK